MRPTGYRARSPPIPQTPDGTDLPPAPGALPVPQAPATPGPLQVGNLLLQQPRLWPSGSSRGHAVPTLHKAVSARLRAQAGPLIAAPGLPLGQSALPALVLGFP